jgi:hypothetical protein
MPDRLDCCCHLSIRDCSLGVARVPFPYESHPTKTFVNRIHNCIDELREALLDQDNAILINDAFDRSELGSCTLPIVFLPVGCRQDAPAHICTIIRTNAHSISWSCVDAATQLDICVRVLVLMFHPTFQYWIVEDRYLDVLLVIFIMWVSQWQRWTDFSGRYI